MKKIIKIALKWAESEGIQYGVDGNQMWIFIRGLEDLTFSTSRKSPMVLMRLSDNTGAFPRKSRRNDTTEERLDEPDRILREKCKILTQIHSLKRVGEGMGPHLVALVQLHRALAWVFDQLAGSGLSFSPCSKRARRLRPNLSGPPPI